jgi:transcription elongation factor GreA
MIVISGLEAKQYSITAEGLQELQQQLDDLKQRRREVAEEMRDITSQSTDQGALEDSTLSLNQNQATEIDGQISLLERIIGMADIIEKPSDTSTVQPGSKVTVKLDGKESAYIIVGAVEADPLEGKISTDSPLGQSLLGKKVGDTVEAVSATGQHTVTEVVAIG